MSYLDAPPEPIGTFLDWYDEAVRRGAPFADAMTLATADGNGRPSARTVLFKGVVDGCVSFVSNFDSRKGRELAHNPAAALVFFWPALGRQVRFEGIVTRQLGAWASPQSEAIVSRAELEAAVEAARRRFAGRDVERPPNWGMYLLAPEYVELWISGDHRLHDRFAYRRDGDAWRGERLAP